MIFYHDLTSLLVLSLTSAVLAAPIYNGNASLNGSPSPSVAGSQLDSSPPCPNDASSNSSCMPVETTGVLPRANGTSSSGLSSNTTEGDSLSISSTSPSTGSPGPHILLPRSILEVRDEPTVQEILEECEKIKKEDARQEPVIGQLERDIRQLYKDIQKRQATLQELHDLPNEIRRLEEQRGQLHVQQLQLRPQQKSELEELRQGRRTLQQDIRRSQGRLSQLESQQPELQQQLQQRQEECEVLLQQREAEVEKLGLRVDRLNQLVDLVAAIKNNNNNHH